MQLIFRKNNKGFSLVEMLIYTALLSFFMIIVINAGIIMVGAYSRARSAKLLNGAAISTFSTLSSEIRGSSDVLSSSVLGSSPGVLVLSAPGPSGIETIEFFVSNGKLVLRRNGVLVGNMTSDDVTVESLIFYKIVSSKGMAVRTVLDLRANRGGENSEEKFYLTTVLRESY